MEDELVHTGQSDSAFDTLNWPRRGYYFVPPVAAFIFSAVFAGLPLLWNDQWLFFFQLLAFVVLGVVCARLLRTSLQSFFQPKGIATIVATLCVIAIVFYSFSFAGVYFWWLSIAAIGSAFLLPFVLMEFWMLYLQLSVKSAKIWREPENWPAAQSRIFLNGMVVQFHVLMSPEQKEPHVVLYNVSKQMNLGEAFLDMLQKQKNNGIREFSLVASGQTSFAWIFFITNKLGLNRNLDPQISLPENGVKKNTNIHACRFSLPAQRTGEQSPLSKGYV